MKLSRRSFIKYAGITMAVGVASRYFKLAVATLDTISKPMRSLKVVRSTCSPNDTGACGMMATVSDGRIVSLIQAADYPEAEYNPRGCLKGLSMLKLIYGPDRLKHPLIRVGKRGEGKFRVATWEEALDYAMDFGRGLDRPLADRFVGMYVNDLTRDYGDRGRRAIERFLAEGSAAGLVPELRVEFVQPA